MSYKMSFIYDFISIFLKVLILFFISKFIKIDQQLSIDIGSYFSYAIFGLCFMDVLTLIVGSAPREIDNMKKTGILEEIILLPMGNYAAIFGCNLYQIFMSLLKVIIYLIFGSALAGYPLIDFQYFFYFILTLLFILSSFVFISLIASSFSIWFARTSLVPILYVTSSLILSEIYFPKELLYEELSFFSVLFSLSPALENFRMLNEIGFNYEIFMGNLAHLFILNIFYGLSSILMLRHAIKYAKSNGSFLYY